MHHHNVKHAFPTIAEPDLCTLELPHGSQSITQLLFVVHQLKEPIPIRSIRPTFETKHFSSKPRQDSQFIALSRSVPDDLPF